MRRSLIALTVAASVTSAHAQSPIAAAPRISVPTTQSCSCVAARGEAISLSNVSGRVSVLSNNGFNPVERPVAVQVGSRVMVGPDGGALLSVGQSCALKLGVATDADIAVSDGKVCVRTAKSSADSFLAQDRRDFVNPPPPDTAFDPALLAGGVVVLGGIGAGIGLAVSGSRGGGSAIPIIGPVPQVSP